MREMQSLTAVELERGIGRNRERESAAKKTWDSAQNRSRSAVKGTLSHIGQRRARKPSAAGPSPVRQGRWCQFYRRKASMEQMGGGKRELLTRKSEKKFI